MLFPTVSSTPGRTLFGGNREKIYPPAIWTFRNNFSLKIDEHLSPNYYNWFSAEMSLLFDAFYVFLLDNA
jgi:hypothetical protein